MHTLEQKVDTEKRKQHRQKSDNAEQRGASAAPATTSLICSTMA
jgi:hypothetical protein